MKKISLTLSRNSLIYKSFIRPILYYIYVIYEKPLNEPLKINQKQSNIMQLLLLMVQLKIHCVTVFTESSVQNSLLKGDRPVRFFLPQNNALSFTCISTYSHRSVTVVKEFIKRHQQTKRTLGSSLQEQKYFISVILFSLLFLIPY